MIFSLETWNVREDASQGGFHLGFKQRCICTEKPGMKPGLEFRNVKYANKLKSMPQSSQMATPSIHQSRETVATYPG
jgi:hypothetical protein